MNIDTLKKAYRKLKSAVYYDNSVLFLKKQIAEFEVNINDKLDALVNSYNNEFDQLSNELVSSIKVKCFPKNIDLIPEENENLKNKKNIIISNNNSESNLYHVDKISYFIQMDIEAHVLGVAWILTAGKLLESSIYEHAYGNRLKKGLDEELELITNTPFLFKPYFQAYETWRDHAINHAKETLKQNQDVLIVSLDLMSYFYSTNIDFNKMRVEIEKIASKAGIELTDDYISLTNFVELVFMKYSSKFHFEKGMERTIIPIGFLPANIISNWYLNELDNDIIHQIKPIYYGRYVDDMLIVVNAISYRKSGKKITQRTVIEDLFEDDNYSKKKLLRSDKKIDSNDSNEELEIKYTLEGEAYKHIKVQNKKIRIFHLSATGSTAILDNFKKEIKKVSSEFRFLHEESRLNLNFEEAVYKTNYEDTINKFRGIKSIEIDKFELSKYLAKVLYINKYDDKTKNIETADNILKAFRGVNSIRFQQFWEKVFLYFVLQEEWSNIVEFFLLIAKNLKEITVSAKLDVGGIDYLLGDKNIEESLLKKTLYEVLNISLASAISLKWSDKSKECVKNIFKRIAQDEYLVSTLQQFSKKLNKIDFETMSIEVNAEKALNEYIGELRLSLLQSNMIKHQFIKVPLSNYARCLDKDISNHDFTKLESPCLSSNCSLIKGTGCFIGYKDEYSPRFVHLHETIIYNLIAQLYNGERIDSIKVIEDAYDQIFIPINFPLYNINRYKSDFTQKNQYYEIVVNSDDNSKKKSIYKYNHIKVGKFKKSQLRIAVGNVKIKEQDIINAIRGNSNASPDRLSQVSKIINQAAELRVDILVLPECYLPYEWLQLIAEQSKKHQMMIIVGLEHRTYVSINERLAFNYIATFIPGKIQEYQYVIPLLRLKNYYAPSELKLLEGNGYTPIEGYKAPVGEKWDLIEWNGAKIAPYYCFEIADIAARALFKSEVDIITISEYNRDVNYFSNIIESLSRDLHCYCAQSNASQFGDSRIVQPSKTETMNILKVKGGINQFIMVEEIDIDKLREFQTLDYRLQEERKDQFKQTPPNFDKQKSRDKLGYQ